MILPVYLLIMSIGRPGKEMDVQQLVYSPTQPPEVSDGNLAEQTIVGTTDLRFEKP
jgi:hypothetical protein